MEGPSIRSPAGKLLGMTKQKPLPIFTVFYRSAHPFSPMPSLRRDTLLNALALIAVVLFIFWLCAFKIFDADFFWHVTAGRLMRETGGLITIDPFAYTREGLPYLANHEWLAQIILSLVIDLFGSTGVILLRSTLVATSILLVLCIGKQNLWIYVPLGMFAALTIRSGAMDRPHLWTWVMVAAFLFVSARVLRIGKMHRKDVAILVVLQILWVNLHGAAALLGVVIGSALALQLMVHQRKFIPAILPVLLAAATLVSPLGWSNVTYLQTLLHDTTTDFIAEWQPREWSLYITDLWPFWIVALGSLLFARKHLVFWIILLFVFGYLSRTAYRHEMLLVLVVLALVVMQLERSALSKRCLEWMHERLYWSASVILILVLGLIFFASSENLAFANRYHAHGYGMIDRTADVSAFLDREKITGKIFNTYNLGFELLYHFSPDRKVFVDGRNVDYGAEFLSPLIAAGLDANTWDVLEQKYGFTIAIIDLPDFATDSPPYIIHLQNNPHWPLVYLDDAVAVYIKDVSENRERIARLQYHFLTPTGFQLAGVQDPERVIAELQRSIDEAPGSIDARLHLARFLLGQGLSDRAEPQVKEALVLAPDDYRSHEVLGLLRAQQGRFDEAETAFDHALGLLTREAAVPIREYFARIFTSLGETDRAKRYE